MLACFFVLFRVTMIPARLKLASRHVSSSCAVHLQTATSIRKLAVHLPTSYGSRRYSLAVKTSQAGPSSTAVEGDKPSSPTKLDKIIRDTIMVRIDFSTCLLFPAENFRKTGDRSNVRIDIHAALSLSSNRRLLHEPSQLHLRFRR